MKRNLKARILEGRKTPSTYPSGVPGTAALVQPSSFRGSPLSGRLVPETLTKNSHANRGERKEKLTTYCLFTGSLNGLCQIAP